MRIIGLYIFFFSLNLSAQNSTQFFRALPSSFEIAQAPDWAQKMYSQNPNVNEVVDLYNHYFKTSPFQKSIHTQNFKHWIRQTEPLLDEKSQIKPATEVEEQAKYNLLKSIKSRNSQKSMDAWSSIGPFETYKNGTLQPISHHANVYSIDQSENNDQLLICGTESGGVFKTTDKEMNWSLISKSEVFCNGITAVKIHPSDDNTFYISGNNRLYKSIDGGSSWSENYNLNGSVYEIKFDPDDANHIFLSSSNGLYESSNAGTSWTKPFSETSWDLDFHPTDHDTVYLLKSNSGLIKSEFFRSTDSGANWTLINSGWYSPEVPAEAAENGGKLAVSPNEPDRVYVTLIGSSKANDNGWIGLYRSDNAGSSWYLPSGQIGGPYNAANTMPWNADLMWFGTIRLNESSDGGYSYESIGAANSIRLSDIHADIQSIHLSTSDIWIASDGGINYSNDDLQSHSSRKRGIIASNFWGFGAGWNEDVLVGGKYHNGNTAYYEPYGSGESHNVGGVEESTGYVNPLVNQNAYFNQYWSGYTISKLLADTLGGATTNLFPINLIPNESYLTSYSSGFYHHPYYADEMIAGKDSIIWVSHDGGSNWSELHDFGMGRVLEMEYCRSNPEVIYAVFQPIGGYWDPCKIYKTTDGGSNWSALKDVPSPNRWRIEITTNPQDENEIWAASVNGPNGQKVYKSMNGGNTWTNMTSTDFDVDKIRDLAYHGGSGGLVYALTENSFYYYDPTSTNWIQLDSGLPTVQNVLKIKLYYKDKKIRLATSGRGIWEAEMPQTFDPIALPMTSRDTSFCLRDTILFDSHSIVDQFNTSWLWNFTPSPSYVSDLTARNPKVVFGNNGSYNVELTVTDNSVSSDSHLISQMVHVESLCDPDTIQGLSIHTFASGDFIQLPDFDTKTNNFTISAWIKPGGIQDNYASILMNDENSAGLNFRESNNTLGYHWAGGQWWWDSNLVVPSDEWSYVALVAEPSGVTISLNGVSVKHNITIDSVDLETMKIGSYKGWTSRNYRGEIDELCMWNRSLSPSEIRAFLHLTKEDIISDPDLLAYYQFNINDPLVLDKANLFHGVVVGNTIFQQCYAPFGGRVSSSMNISTSGNYVFGSTGTGSLPNGEVVVSRINLLPLPTINNGENLGSYFIMNNYGNTSFTDPFELSFDDPYSSPSPNAINTPSSVSLLNRIDMSESLPWVELCDLSSVAGENYVFNGAPHCTHPEMGQYFLKQCIPNATITDDYYNGDVITISVSDFIHANNTIYSGADVKYSAINEILLNAGFEVKSGAIFEAIMTGCQN